MPFSGRAVTTLDIARERVFTRIGDDPDKPRHSPTLVNDALLDALTEITEQLNLPFFQTTKDITLVAGTRTYRINVTADAQTLPVHISAVHLLDTPNSEERAIASGTVDELLQEIGDHWREREGEPDVWFRGPGTGANWDQIALFPVPDADTVTDWPEIRIYLSVIDYQTSAAGALLHPTDELSSKLLNTATFHAAAHILMSRPGQATAQRASVMFGRYRDLLQQLKDAMSGERQSVYRILHHEP